MKKKILSIIEVLSSSMTTRTLDHINIIIKPKEYDNLISNQ